MESEFNGVIYVTEQEESDEGNDWSGGVWWEDPDTRYTQGQCHALALAMCMERPEWTLGTLEDSQNHVLALTEDGQAVDVTGLCSEWDDEQVVWGEAVVPLPWYGLTRLMGEGYSIPVVDDFTLHCAREVLAENGL